MGGYAAAIRQQPASPTGALVRIEATPVPQLFTDEAGPSPKTSEEISELAARRRLFNHLDIWGCNLRREECEPAIAACKKSAKNAWQRLLAMDPESAAEVEQQCVHALMVAVHTATPRLGPPPSREKHAYSSSDEHEDDPDGGFTLVGRTRHRKQQTTCRQRQSARLDDRHPPKEWWKAGSTARAAPAIRPKPRSGNTTEQYSSGSEEDRAAHPQQRHTSGAGRSSSRRGTP